MTNLDLGFRGLVLGLEQSKLVKQRFLWRRGGCLGASFDNWGWGSSVNGLDDGLLGLLTNWSNDWRCIRHRITLFNSLGLLLFSFLLLIEEAEEAVALVALCCNNLLSGSRALDGLGGLFNWLDLLPWSVFFGDSDDRG